MIGAGNPRHDLRADSADHKIVKQTDEIRNAVLNHYRDHQKKHFFIKRPVTNIFSHSLLLFTQRKSIISYLRLFFNFFAHACKKRQRDAGAGMIVRDATIVQELGNKQKPLRLFVLVF